MTSMENDVFSDFIADMRIAFTMKDIGSHSILKGNSLILYLDPFFKFVKINYLLDSDFTKAQY